MTADLDLDPEQREELARLLDGATLGSLLQKWGRFVTEVELTFDAPPNDWLPATLSPAGTDCTAAE